jgi:uncharacterized membrane protein
MSKRLMLKTCSIAWLVFPLILAGCGNEKPPKISYVQDIQPIIQQYCVECHNQSGSGYLASGLDMSSYQNLMKGTKFGPVIKAGDSVSSTLVILVEGRADPSLKMPHGDKNSLTTEQTKKLRLWIDQGALQN